MKLHIRRGDLVKIISGNARGKQGKVIRVLPKNRKIVVEGVNMLTKHYKPSAKNPQGGIKKKEAPVHISNAMLLDAASGKVSRVGRRNNERNQSERYFKKSGKSITND